MKRGISIFMVMVIALMVCPYTHPLTLNAESTSAIIKTQSCIFNGIKRTLMVDSDEKVFLKIAGEEPFFVASLFETDAEFSNISLDNIGTIWMLDYDDNVIRWWNYDLAPTYCVFRPIPNPSSTNGVSNVNDAKCLVFDDQGFVIGYKDLSDETHPILTLDEMKKILGIPEEQNPTPTPSSQTDTTAQNQQNTSKQPVATQNSNQTTSTTPKTSSKVSIKKSGGYTCLLIGDKVVSKYKLKKGVLTWKGTKKSKKIKQVKQVGFIKKSKNLVYITKKGKVYTISKNGKTKTILKKGAKSFMKKNGFVTKVKKKSGYLDVTKK